MRFQTVDNSCELCDVFGGKNAQSALWDEYGGREMLKVLRV